MPASPLRTALACWCLLASGCYLESSPSPQAAVQVLTELIQDRDALVRRSAAEALGKIGDPTAEPALLIALRDSEPAVREAAARSFARLSSYGAAVTGALLARLEDPDSAVRRAAAQALGGADESQDPARTIARMLASPYPEVRRSAAHAFLYVEDAKGLATDALAQRTKDPDPLVRQWAVAALAETGGREAAPWLVDRLLHDEAEAVRTEAAYRLRFLGDESVLEELKKVPKQRSSAAVDRWLERTSAFLMKASDSDSALPPGPPAQIAPSHRSP
jgi:HEAT repeat protein